ncbi:MAG: hypothetical protein IPN68_11145 [Bacteroidetes bacterium]|nr:hypothetical protein [Bacteroidota bacterium]
MLVQSHLDGIDLLPALPDELKTGRVSGLKARGGYSINMEWKDGELIGAEIITKSKKPVPAIRVKNQLIDPEDFKKVSFKIVSN